MKARTPYCVALAACALFTLTGCYTKPPNPFGYSPPQTAERVSMWDLIDAREALSRLYGASLMLSFEAAQMMNFPKPADAARAARLRETDLPARIVYELTKPMREWFEGRVYWRDSDFVWQKNALIDFYRNAYPQLDERYRRLSEEYYSILTQCP